MSSRGRIILKRGKAKPLWHRHPWVYSGAVQEIRGHAQDGDVIDVMDEHNDFIAKGFLNLHSQIRVRLLSWDIHEKIGKDFFQRKIDEAIFWRERTLAMRSKANAYRLIHSEADGLPGLTVDRYNKVLVAQFLSIGMDHYRDMIVPILQQEAKVETVVEHYTPRYRELEGLPELDHLVHGPEAPEQFAIQEYGLQFQVNIMKGQKTGFYLDQRENRLAVVPYVHGKRVLDAFSYSGGFGIYLLAKGKAANVVFMDSSNLALELVKQNLELNKLPAQQTFMKADIFEKLPEMHKAGERFDVIVLDPPKVAPDRNSLETGLRSLRQINATALQMLPPYGVLVTCDCSGNISWEEFYRALSMSARMAGRPIRILESRTAGPDHPAHPACPESSYLKVVIAVALPADAEPEPDARSKPEEMPEKIKEAEPKPETAEDKPN